MSEVVVSTSTIESEAMNTARTTPMDENGIFNYQPAGYNFIKYKVE